MNSYSHITFSLVLNQHLFTPNDLRMGGGSKVKVMYIHFIFGMLACIYKCFCVCVLSISNIPMSLTAKMSIFFSLMPDLFFCVNCR